MTEPSRILIIGAGHNALVCATLLAKAGRQVLVLEASDQLGGMAAERQVGDYRFPGLAHLEFPVAEDIRKALQLDHHGYQSSQGVRTVSLGSNGRHLSIEGAQLAGDDLPEGDVSSWARFRREYLEYAQALKPLFTNRPPRLKDMDFFDKKNLAKLAWRIRMGLGRESMYEFLRVAGINIYDILNESFSDPRLKGALSVDAVLGNAMGPRTPGTVLTWMQRLQGELTGAVSVAGGSSSLTPALVRAAEAAGVKMRTGARVDRIRVADYAIQGITLDDGENIDAAQVVSGADPRTTFNDLLGAPELDTMFATRASQIRGMGVVAKLHVGLSGLPAFSGLAESDLSQRLLVAPSADYVERAFNHCKYDEVSENPVLEITLPSLHHAGLAPEGHHVMSVNVAFVPYFLENGWEGQAEVVADRIITQLEHYAPGLGSLVTAREFLTPVDIERETGAVQGHWHHGEMTLHQSFMLRPLYGAAQFTTPIDGLFLCGAGCHPGGGLTGRPGQLAAQRVLDS